MDTLIALACATGPDSNHRRLPQLQSSSSSPHHSSSPSVLPQIGVQRLLSSIAAISQIIQELSKCNCAKSFNDSNLTNNMSCEINGLSHCFIVIIRSLYIAKAQEKLAEIELKYNYHEITDEVILAEMYELNVISDDVLQILRGFSESRNWSIMDLLVEKSIISVSPILTEIVYKLFYLLWLKFISYFELNNLIHYTKNAGNLHHKLPAICNAKNLPSFFLTNHICSINYILKFSQYLDPRSYTECLQSLSIESFPIEVSNITSHILTLNIQKFEKSPSDIVLQVLNSLESTRQIFETTLYKKYCTKQSIRDQFVDYLYHTLPGRSINWHRFLTRNLNLLYSDQGLFILQRKKIKENHNFLCRLGEKLREDSEALLASNSQASTSILTLEKCGDQIESDFGPYRFKLLRDDGAFAFLLPDSAREYLDRYLNLFMYIELINLKLQECYSTRMKDCSEANFMITLTCSELLKTFTAIKFSIFDNLIPGLIKDSSIGSLDSNSFSETSPFVNFFNAFDLHLKFLFENSQVNLMNICDCANELIRLSNLPDISQRSAKASCLYQELMSLLRKFRTGHLECAKDTYLSRWTNIMPFYL